MILVSIWKKHFGVILLSIALITLVGCQPIELPEMENAALAPQNPSTPDTPSTDLPAPTANISVTNTLSQTETISQTIAAQSPEAAPTEVATTEVQPLATGRVKTVLDIALKVVTEGDVPGTWILDGEGVGDVNPGESVIIYGVLVQGTEAAIAQAQVIAQSADSLIVQILLEHPRQDVRSGLRADANLSQLEASVLIPAASFADGYVLSNERIRLRADHDLAVGTVFQAYEPQMIGQRIADYLPFAPPLMMRVTNIGVTGEVASAELVSGDWPKVGTLISNLGVTEADAIASNAPTVTPIPSQATPAPPALTPPTPTWTPISTPTATWTPQPAATTAGAATPDAVATGVAEEYAVQTAVAATVAAQVQPTNTPPRISTPVPPAAYIEILDPVWAESRQGWHTVRWRYTGALRSGQGFDLLLWYVKEDRRRGVTDARKIAANLQHLGNNEYSVEVNFSAAAAVSQYCDAKYLLAVTVVQLDPYTHIGPQSDGVQIQVAPLPGGPCG